MKKVLFILLAAAFLAGCSKEAENLPDFSGFEDLEFPKKERKEPEEPDNSELEEESPAAPEDETPPEESPDIPEDETTIEESAPEAPAEKAEDYDSEEAEEDITEPETEEPEESPVAREEKPDLEESGPESPAEDPLPEENSPAAPEDETTSEESPVAREEEPDLEESAPESPAEAPLPEENSPAGPEDETTSEESPDTPEDETTSEESPDTPEDETPPEENPIIQEEEPDILPGFLLFSDGTTGPGPMEGKTPAGVVFEAENGDLYAVGLSKSATRKAWATKTSGGQELSSFSMEISEITYEKSGEISFGDSDGSDNEKIILEHCPEAELKHFPVFYWASHYGEKEDLGIYNEGWYIPTVYETEILLENRIYIEETLQSLGVNLFDSEEPVYVWTSNTPPGFPKKAWRCDLISGTFSLYGKGSSSENFGLVIRKL